MTGLPGWNHNIHYGVELLDLVPPGAQRALDVGCGEGWLVRALSKRVPQVVGIDPDAASISLARNAPATRGVEYLETDLFGSDLSEGSFDFITCIAALHHLDEESALRRMAELLKPGGTLGVVGLARSRRPRDLLWDLGGAVSTRVHKLTKTYWETPAPKVWPPPHTYAEVRQIAQSVLPGSRFHRRVLWRYVLMWTKPRSRQHPTRERGPPWAAARSSPVRRYGRGATR